MPRLSLIKLILFTLLLSCGKKSLKHGNIVQTQKLSSSCLETQYTVVGDWGSEFQGKITLENQCPLTLEDWKLEFELSANMQSLWNGKILKNSPKYIVGAEAWNNQIIPGKKIEIGFIAKKNGDTQMSNLKVLLTQEISQPEEEEEVEIKPEIEVSYMTTSIWTQGGQGKILLKNTGSTTLKSWQLNFQFGHNITSIWNAGIQNSNSTYALIGKSWNKDLLPGKLVEIGFIFSKEPNSQIISPTNFVINNQELGETPPIIPPTDDEEETPVEIPEDSQEDIVESPETTPAPIKEVMSVYWAGWTGGTHNLKEVLKNTKVNVINLSFADYTHERGIDTSISGSFTKIPAECPTQPCPWVLPSYTNWTQYAYANPDSKVILSVGGATFSHIWNNEIVKIGAVDVMVDRFANLINTQFPVYSGSNAYVGDRQGYVQIDGIDLDVEAGGKEGKINASHLIVEFSRKLRMRLKKGQFISYTGMHVGADPVSNCTFPGSSHCGEDRPILQAAKEDPTLFDWVNVMAYDAGSSWGGLSNQDDQGIKKAMNNFASFVGKDKVILGLASHNGNWGWGRAETPEELADKTRWQKDQGFGGVMFWAIGDGNTPKLYLETISNEL